MSSLPVLGPPAHTRSLLSWDVTSQDDLRRIRAGLLRFFTAGEAVNRGDGDFAQRLGLVATELAGNALRHGLPPIVVRLLSDDDCYILDVSDRDPTHPPAPADPDQPARAGGRGLRIAHTLAQRLCWYQAGDTKHVWASFPRPDSVKH